MAGSSLHLHHSQVPQQPRPSSPGPSPQKIVDVFLPDVFTSMSESHSCSCTWHQFSLVFGSIFMKKMERSVTRQTKCVLETLLRMIMTLVLRFRKKQSEIIMSALKQSCCCVSWSTLLTFGSKVIFTRNEDSDQICLHHFNFEFHKRFKLYLVSVKPITSSRWRFETIPNVML